jgi:predicted AlkP superfamily pyrophosphatase or phosphodiesterase
MGALPDGLPPGPRYERGAHRLLPSALAAVTGTPDDLLAWPHPPRAVAVLVIDGLGHRLLDEHAAAAPTLSAATREMLHAPFPTTTATSLTSIGTGRPPGEHGIVGYSFAVPGDDRPLFALTWSWERHDPRCDARPDVDPERLQPMSTAFEVAVQRGVRAVTVLRPEFAGSGLTRAGLRGGQVVEASDLETTLRAVESALAGPGPTVVYAHHGDLDALGHLTGPDSPEWLAELERIDGAVARSISRLPRDTVLLVTADHGMVHVPEEGFVELTEHTELLAGVRVLTGDARARQLHTAPGAGDEVLAAWREHCGTDAWVTTRDEAIAAGWFGPRITDTARAHIGDVVVSARALDKGWVHKDLDLLGGRMPGLHGALTDEELEVPAIMLTRDG